MIALGYFWTAAWMAWLLWFSPEPPLRAAPNEVLAALWLIVMFVPGLLSFIWQVTEANYQHDLKEARRQRLKQLAQLEQEQLDQDWTWLEYPDRAMPTLFELPDGGDGAVTRSDAGLHRRSPV